MASNDEELIYEAIAAHLEAFAYALPFDVHWHGAAYSPVYGRAFIKIGQVTTGRSSEAGSPVHSRIDRQLILTLHTPEADGDMGWILMAEALREHFFQNEEITDLQSGAGPFVRIEQRPELLKSSSRSDEVTETVYGFVRGRLGVNFFFEPTV